MKTLKLNSKGTEVKYLQQLLAKRGYCSLLPDGIFGRNTETAVKDFQGRQELTADGIAGYRTWEALFFAGHAASGKLTDEDFARAAQLLDVETAALKAVQLVETGGRGGFFEPGYPAILFEGHIFWGELKKKGITPEDERAGNEDILYPKWTKEHYKGGMAEYSRLEKARGIHREAADASASWGMFQILGNNHPACGEENIKSFVNAMCESECKQLILAARFIHNDKRLLAALQQKNWKEFARIYNGAGYAANKYDEKLAKAYTQFKK